MFDNWVAEARQRLALGPGASSVKLSTYRTLLGTCPPSILRVLCVSTAPVYRALLGLILATLSEIDKARCGSIYICEL
ncbi:hypothetical protein J6590_055194 [Homalodisca vitripennis]|nr:hypothetical protein J6590_055194 [Homalodisca vitripennis]